MKKTYKQLSSELILVETEGTCMTTGSVRINSVVTVEEYKNFTDWTGGTKLDDDSFDISFD